MAFAGASAAAKAMGAVHNEKDVKEVNVDKKNHIVTTPAYMKNTTPDKVALGIEKMVHSVLDRLRD
eukprot:CAMPEP_0115024780 /NCGR_PEP_ID=MMETSP0216-20121206/33507_1 /TAXON_ID=223996 /ORGANISM="Protocruzia adherens, Strain Boccale" /LENGTH=65 /DNA_ID=CAMNT_0002399035 /DNA_START=8 /DNA_END=206 /DNA_ORIENTATION=-